MCDEHISPVKIKVQVLKEITIYMNCSDCDNE